jgi:hypothetical protein
MDVQCPNTIYPVQKLPQLKMIPVQKKMGILLFHILLQNGVLEMLSLPFISPKLCNFQHL